MAAVEEVVVTSLVLKVLEVESVVCLRSIQVNMKEHNVGCKVPGNAKWVHTQASASVEVVVEA